MYFYGVKFYLADVNYAKAQNLSEISQSQAYLEKAVRLNPKMPQYRAVLARNYLSQALTEMQKNKDDQDANKIQALVAVAINQARVATELAPKQIAMWETLGMVYREIRTVATGAIEWGIKSFEEAINLEPKNPVFYTELGKLYLANNQMDKAQEQFKKAAEVKADYTDALIQQVLLLEKQGDSSAAIAEMKALAVDYPYSTEIVFQLGRLYFNQNQINEAINQFKRVIVLAPDHSNAHYSLGVAYAAQGKKVLAREQFLKVLELNPGNQDVQAKLNALK
jgi:tetratricopeptide (TPR) repeat protein